jgi:predicted RNA-binding protein with PIN domain
VGVVTSDRMEGDLAFGMGCSHWTVAEFVEELARTRREMDRWGRKHSLRGRRTPLGSGLGENHRLDQLAKGKIPEDGDEFP